MNKPPLRLIGCERLCGIFLILLFITPGTFCQQVTEVSEMAPSFTPNTAFERGRSPLKTHNYQIDPASKLTNVGVHQTDIQELKPGSSIERELAGGGSHFYRLSAVAGQFLSFQVDQKGINVRVEIVGPDGKHLALVDNNSAVVGSEIAFTIAEITGDHQVNIRSTAKAAPAGRYVLRTDDLREATPQDRVRVTGERSFAEGNRLSDLQTTESRIQAIKKYEEALPLWREVGDKRREAYALAALGDTYFFLGETIRAADYYSQQLPLWRDIGDVLNEAVTLNNIGFVYWRMSEFQKALESLFQALPLRRQAGDRRGEANTLNNIGLIYQDLGNFAKASEFYNEALPLRRAVADTAGEASTLNNIGQVQRRLGDLQLSLQLFEQALPLWRAAGNRRSEGVTLNNIGAIYSELEEFQTALEYYDKALTLNRGVSDRHGEASTLHNQGRVYLKLGDQHKAIEHFSKALALFRAVSDRSGQAAALTSLAQAYFVSDNVQKALEQYGEALEIRQAIGDPYYEADTLRHMAVTYTSLKKSEKALEFSHEALKKSRAIKDRLGEARALHGIALLERDRNNLKEAQEQIRLAIEIIESTRSKIASQELRSSFSASRQSFYSFYVDLLMRMHSSESAAGNDVRAFEISERAHARGLLEMLTEARIDVREGIASNLRKREQDVQARLSQIQNQLILANSRSKPDSARITSLEQEFAKVDAERAAVEVEIRQKHPRYAKLQYPAPLGLKAIQQALDNHTVLLEYSLGADASYLFAITRNDFLTARLPAAATLKNQVTALRDAIAIKPDRSAVSNYLQKSVSLHQDLVQPASRLLRGKRSLIIIPDGILHYLPFEVLLQSDSSRTSNLNFRQLPYLVSNYSISYAPSATVMVNLRTSEEDNQVAARTFLGFGDALYTKSDSEQHATVRSALQSAAGETKPWELQQLPESRREIQRIAGLFSPTKVDVFLGEDAKEENVKAEGQQNHYRFLHFAVHGLLNENKPQYSGLVLSLPRDANEKVKPQEGAAPANRIASDDVSSRPAVEDGLLQVYEIFNLKLDADLIVLSACETGLGKETRGEGLVGLTQAFLYAGTKSLVVTVWKVQDRSTSDLMVGFYRHLKNPRMNNAEALRQTKLEMIRKGVYSHPYYWAGFVLIGQP